jgi:hypothetical protein
VAEPTKKKKEREKGRLGWLLGCIPTSHTEAAVMFVGVLYNTSFI